MAKDKDRGAKTGKKAKGAAGKQARGADKMVRDGGRRTK